MFVLGAVINAVDRKSAQSLALEAANGKSEVVEDPVKRGNGAWN